MNFVPNSASCLGASTGTAAATFASAINFIISAQCLVNEPWPRDADVQGGNTFDFIIIGAGTAGCVVANRLSEITQWKILLIEAGGDPPLESTIPNLDKSVYHTKSDWGYKTADNGRTNQANKNGSINWTRGKMLGGSGGINAMIYIRGNDHDFQKWYDLGCKDWHPDVVKKYYVKAESFQNGAALRSSKVRSFFGRNGPQTINRFNNTQQDVLDKVLKSYNDIGFKNVPDLNVAGSLGSGNFDCTASNGQRDSAAVTYLNIIRDRENLKVIKNSHVTRILIIETTKQAYGVEFDRNGIKSKVYAAMEVIVSAGAINTPQILMLSGIGSKEQLASKDIPCLVNLPAVGQNLQDHLIIPIPIFGHEPGPEDKTKQHFQALEYLYNRKGYLAEGSLGNIMAFYSNEKHAKYPLFQTHLTLFNKNSSKVQQWAESVANYKAPIVKSLVDKNVNHSLYLFLFNLLHPHSTGNITLKSADYNDPPQINPNYFEDPRDLKLSVEGIKMLTKIVKTEYFKSIGGYLASLDWPACNKFELDSYEYWACVCIDMVLTVYHPVGTSKMGVDPYNSVVDNRLKVHGTKSLRVIDAGVMPTEPSGNINGPTMMIGERGSDLIKEDYGVLDCECPDCTYYDL